MISCNQPMGDFFYTVCFVSLKDSTFCSKNSSFFSSAYVMTLYCYRIIANGRVFHKMIMAKPDKKYDFTLGPFLSIMRSAMSLLTSSAALLNKQKVFENALYLWIVFATITTLYSWIIDLKGDWGFLDLKAKRILREKLIFPKAKAVYYIIAILNLALRTAWVLSLSPFMINSQGFSPFLFTMMISYL
jgi:hypothetical protein